MKSDLLEMILKELHFDYLRSPGPGGQNVNKVASAVQLRFDALHSASLSSDLKTRLIKLAGSRATLEGEIILVARRHRNQEQNRQDALDRLAALLERASRPIRTRIATRPTRSSKARRRREKTFHSLKKTNRQRRTGIEEI